MSKYIHSDYNHRRALRFREETPNTVKSKLVFRLRLTQYAWKAEKAAGALIPDFRCFPSKFCMMTSWERLFHASINDWRKTVSTQSVQANLSFGRIMPLNDGFRLKWTDTPERRVLRSSLCSKPHPLFQQSNNQAVYDIIRIISQPSASICGWFAFQPFCC